ncbi:MAG: glycosyltransferase [Candidatus Chisholmbacteria bacterium]|nr:glycosyltransferase [Candidatus Chisholmbacteria bacterium]
MPSKPSLPEFTVHTIIKNEDRWIWYALMSVIDVASKIIVFDTGSTDKTPEIIQTINSPKIVFEHKPQTTRSALVKLRQEQLDRTTTPWFLLVDGDEIWPQKNLFKLLKVADKSSQKVMAFFTRTRNCVGDISHYLPESKGQYHIKGITGHLNRRTNHSRPEKQTLSSSTPGISTPPICPARPTAKLHRKYSIEPKSRNFASA